MITVDHIGKKNLLEDCLNILRIKLEKNCLMKDKLILPINNNNNNNNNNNKINH